ncbi:MAG: NADH-quinone oxidoreductase subunit C [Burkholderiales bacterium]|nr:NADH-quinone oxidoreductase subunit C [Burkholderiales bacterium]
MDAINEKYALAFVSLAGVSPAYRAEVNDSDWKRIALLIQAEGGRLIAIWGGERGRDGNSDLFISAAYCVAEGILWLRMPVKASEGYPDLSAVFPFAARMQRAVYDLVGIPAQGAPDQRPWLDHGVWTSIFPLRQHCDEKRTVAGLEQYPFVKVEGDGVHEIAVGPIHAGIIEPGHFRFSVVGEKVLRLEQKLGFAHKGIAKLFMQRTLADGHELASRISGDSALAYAWAYCMAAEAVSRCDIPLRAQWLRALLLERERIANHLGDLGALGNDAGLAFGLSQFSKLREDCLRLNEQLFQHRLLMDVVLPGGIKNDLDSAGIVLLQAQCDVLEREIRKLQIIYEEHSGVQDRFITAGKVSPALAAKLGLCGLAGRASAQAWDARTDQAITPYPQLNVRMATHRNGDVAARVIVRFEELLEALRLSREILRQLPAGPTRLALPRSGEAGTGIGWVEGWRGPVLVALESDAQGRILGCHCHDPSWQNWPVLEHAILGNIVPDFPLINKSFNLSYAGHDL